MIPTNQVVRAAAMAAILFSFTGCQGPSAVDRDSGRVVVRDEATIITMGFDNRDYRAIAQKLYDSMVTSANIEPGKVVAMGPVVIATEPRIQFDPVTMHEELATLAQRGGLFAISEVVRASAVVNTDAEADKFVETTRRKIQELEVAKSQIDNDEDWKLYGELAKVNYMLVFRLSCQTQQAGKIQETTYRFNCRLVGVRTGLRKWGDQVTYTKAR
jgi:PBP1b-binding outer membrane lipoprotein LpoB